jgi:asparagine synthase (glutamine-hydrolysing)
VLSGDGGDELLAGYSYWYSGMNKLQDYIYTGKDNLHISKLILQSLKNFSAFPKNNELEGKQLYEKYGSLTDLFYSQRDFFNKNDLKEFGFNNSTFKTNEEKPESLDDALRLDLKYYLSGDILVKTDRASMANGLEIRSPFLDVDLASFCISLSHTLKINKKTDKILLREAYANQWPESIQTRKKMGFGAPIQEWLRLDDFIEMKREYLGNKNKKIHSYLDYQKTKQYVDLSNYQTWILLVLSLWLEHR